MAAAAAVLGVTGCVSSVPSPISNSGQTGGPVASPTPVTPAAAADGEWAAPVAPLTGLPAASAAAASRPAIAIAVTGPRCTGLAAADLVFEEITAPAVRYLAVFQSRAAAAVGPVTGTRPADGMALSVLHPLTGYDGGTTGFLQVLHHTNIVDAGYQAHSSLYTGGPGGLTTSTAAIGRAARDTPPPPLFSYRGGGPGGDDQLATTGVQRISSVRVIIPRAGPQTWVFDAGQDRWVQTGGGPRVAVSDLIIQWVAYKQVYTDHRAGITVPSARVIGRGRVLVVTGTGGTTATGPRGLAAPGFWAKPGLRDVTNYLDTAHLPMALQPGPAWIILAPRGTQVRTQ